MIKANELRIGNWVIINTPFCMDYDAMHDTYIDDDWDELKPIPLTEEWIKKFGFKSLLDDPECTGELTENGQYVIIEDESMRLEIMFGFKKDGSILIHFNDCDFLNLKYIHQLQNLYFALTGLELTQAGGV